MAFYLTIHIIICVLLVAVILFQDGKAGGLTSVADSSQAMFGAKGAGSFLTKLTSVLALIFMVTSMSLAYLAAPSGSSIASDYQPPEQESKVAPATDAGVDASGTESIEVKKSSDLTPEEREKLGLDPLPEKKEGEGETKPEEDEETKSEGNGEEQ
ncbi:MAG: preprotein translocase subunit SecG [Acidobacteriota bacterium]|nr:preprotein translocase subunit SecG [Acidobacteriota bacterium]